MAAGRGAAAATAETAEAAGAAVGRAVVHLTTVSSTAATTACTSSAAAGSHLPSGIVQLVKSVRKKDTPLFIAGFGMRRSEIMITVPIMHLKPALPLNGCWILGPTCTLLLILSKLNAQNPYHGSNGITVGNGESLNISHTGMGTIKTPTAIFHLGNLTHIPFIKTNLLSVHQFTKRQ